MADPRDPLVLLTPAKRRQASVLDVSRSLALIAVAGTPFFSQQVSSAPPRKPNYPVWTAPNLLHSSFAPEPTTQIRIAYLSNLQVKKPVRVDVFPNATMLMGYAPPAVTLPPGQSDDFSSVHRTKRVGLDVIPNTISLLSSTDTVLLPAFQQDDFCHYVPRKRRVDVQYAPNFVINQPAPTKPFNQNVWDSTQLNKTRYQVDYYYNGVLMPTAGPPIPPVPPADDADSGGLKRPWRGRIPTRPPLKEVLQKSRSTAEKAPDKPAKKEVVAREVKPKTLTKQQLEVTQEQAVEDATQLKILLAKVEGEREQNRLEAAQLTGKALLIAQQQEQLDAAKAELLKQEIELNDVIFVVKTVLQLI